MAYIVENDIVVAALTKQLDSLSGKQTYTIHDLNMKSHTVAVLCKTS